MNYRTLQSSASVPTIIAGSWLAKQLPARQLVALVAVAAKQATLGRLTHKQLAALAGLSVSQFRDARRQHGAPIRPKRAATRQAPRPARETANVDIIDALWRIGSGGFLKIAEMVARDELARAAAASRANGNGAAVTPHHAH